LPPAEQITPYAFDVPRINNEQEIGALVDIIAANAGTWHAVTQAERLALLKDMKNRAIKCCTGAGAGDAKVPAPAIVCCCNLATRADVTRNACIGLAPCAPGSTQHAAASSRTVPGYFRHPVSASLA
jgi:hypothetical protein